MNLDVMPSEVEIQKRRLREEWARHEAYMENMEAQTRAARKTADAQESAKAFMDLMREKMQNIEGAVQEIDDRLRKLESRTPPDSETES